MAPKNFPGRKNARRVRALDRAQAQLASDTRRTANGREVPLSPSEREKINRVAGSTARRILPQAQAEAIRTKKDRSGRGKFARSPA